MSQATEKLSKLMQNLKKLPPARRAYYLKKLKALEELVKKIESTKELSFDISDSQWTLDLANALYRAYNYVAMGAEHTTAGLENIPLQFANNLDKIYIAVADEVAKIPETTGKAVGKLTGAGDYWPYLLGAGVALGAVYYLTNIAPIRR